MKITKHCLRLLILLLSGISLLGCGNTESNSSDEDISITSLKIEGVSTFDMSKTPSVQYKAIISPENANTDNLKWYVDDSSIATIDQTGLLTGCTAGIVYVNCWAKNENITKSKKVTIYNDGKNLTDAEGIAGADKTSSNKNIGDIIKTASNPNDPSSFTTLVWSDEFNGNNAKVSDTWAIEVMKGSATGNRERQEYIDSSDTAKIHDGVLEITATENLKSARLNTYEKVGVQFGKIEARIKFDQGIGSWPAFWMLGYDIKNKRWPNCGEMDIMEHANDDPYIYSTNHWNALGYEEEEIGDGNVGEKASVENVREWHTYGLIWTDTYIQYTLDGENTFKMSYKENGKYIKGGECFDDPFYILLNFAMGGTFVSQFDTTKFTNLPWRMFVDWVRVYQ